MTPDEVTVEGLPYSFPKSHINSLVKPDKGHLYVRLHPPQDKFALLHDFISDRQQREDGGTIIPTISGSFSRPTSFDTDVGAVFCIDIPLYGCGFELYDKNIRWSVLFDKERLPEVSAMRDRAVIRLKEYRDYGDSLLNTRN